MDVLVSEAKVITHRTGNSSLPCLTTKTKYLKVPPILRCQAFGPCGPCQFAIVSRITGTITSWHRWAALQDVPVVTPTVPCAKMSVVLCQSSTLNNLGQ